MHPPNVIQGADTMSATLTPPPPVTGPGEGGPTGPDPHRRTQPRWPGRRGLVALVAVAALIGGVASAGVFALTGDDGSTTSTTTVLQPTGSSGQTTIAQAIYTSASPGVVEITASGSSQSGPFGQAGGSQTSTGTGFVVDANGHIVTAAHVVDGASSVKVAFSDGTQRSATVVGKDDATDVAVLKIDPSGLTLHPLALGRSAGLTVGDALVAIGSPFGYQESVSTGIVSGLDRTIQAPNGFTVAHAIQTDAALNPGNSGGPILDSSGRVIGIADQIATNGSSQQSSGVGFAVPIDLVAAELGSLENGQTVKHAYLGVSSGDATSATGALVGAVTSGSPAAAAGVRAGDIITAVDGRPITGSGGLVAAIAAHRAGDHVTLAVRRGSGTRTLTVTLGTQPKSTGSAG
jgi:putative serine protease PepD